MDPNAANRLAPRFDRRWRDLMFGGRRSGRPSLVGAFRDEPGFPRRRHGRRSRCRGHGEDGDDDGDEDHHDQDGTEDRLKLPGNRVEVRKRIEPALRLVLREVRYVGRREEVRIREAERGCGHDAPRDAERDREGTARADVARGEGVVVRASRRARVRGPHGGRAVEALDRVRHRREERPRGVMDHGEPGATPSITTDTHSLGSNVYVTSAAPTGSPHARDRTRERRSKIQ